MKTRRREKNRGTKTSSFGSPGRIGHDSTRFYTSRLYEGLPEEQKVEYVENPVPPQFLDKIFCKSSEGMDELPDDSVHLMITSPPYNVGKEYDENLTLEEYRAFLKRAWKEVCRERSKRWRNRHREYLSLYRKENKERHCEYMRDYMRKYRKRKKQEEENNK